MNYEPQHAVEDQRRHCFFIVQNVVIDEYLSRIGPYAFAVYCYLVRRAGQKSNAYPSIPRIAKDCGMNEKTVRAAIQRLSEESLIGVKERFSEHGDRESNRYSILEPKGEVGPSGGTTLPTPTVGEEDSVKKTQSCPDDDDPMGKIPLKGKAVSLTDEQAAVARTLTESVMLSRSHCITGEKEMWIELFELGLTLDVGQRVIEEVLSRKKTLGRPSSMCYFNKPLKDEVAKSAKGQTRRDELEEEFARYKPRERTQEELAEALAQVKALNAARREQ